MFAVDMFIVAIILGTVYKVQCLKKKEIVDQGGQGVWTLVKPRETLIGGVRQSRIWDFGVFQPFQIGISLI